MSFQAYLNTILIKTGKDPGDLRKRADQKGFTQRRKLTAGVKAGQIVEWHGKVFDLGHGHALVLYALLKGDKQAKDLDNPNA